MGIDQVHCEINIKIFSKTFVSCSQIVKTTFADAALSACSIFCGKPDMSLSWEKTTLSDLATTAILCAESRDRTWDT